MVELAFKHVGLDWRDHVETDARLFRQAEVCELTGDYSKAHKTFGWEPQVSFEELIVMMVDAEFEMAKSSQLLQDYTPFV
jgi:GDPmannose 4,6-dehydratase